MSASPDRALRYAAAQAARLLADGIYRNRFETGLSVKILTGPAG